MSRAIAVIGIVAVLACVGGLCYYLYDSHPQYEVTDLSVVTLLDVSTATFTVTAELDDPSTISIWAGDQQLSVLGVREWTVPAGSYENTFVTVLPEVMSEEAFDDCLEVHFDGKTGWRR